MKPYRPCNRIEVGATVRDFTDIIVALRKQGIPASVVMPGFEREVVVSSRNYLKNEPQPGCELGSAEYLDWLTENQGWCLLARSRDVALIHIMFPHAIREYKTMVELELEHDMTILREIYWGDIHHFTIDLDEYMCPHSN